MREHFKVILIPLYDVLLPLLPLHSPLYALHPSQTSSSPIPALLRSPPSCLLALPRFFVLLTTSHELGSEDLSQHPASYGELERATIRLQARYSCLIHEKRWDLDSVRLRPQDRVLGKARLAMRFPRHLQLGASASLSPILPASLAGAWQVLAKIPVSELQVMVLSTFGLNDP